MVKSACFGSGKEGKEHSKSKNSAEEITMKRILYKTKMQSAHAGINSKMHSIRNKFRLPLNKKNLLNCELIQGFLSNSSLEALKKMKLLQESSISSRF